MEDSYIIWLYVPDLSFKNRGSRKQFLSIQEFRENLAMHKALKKSLLEDEAAKQKESWWRNYGKRIDCKYQMNFLYLNIQIKITIQIVGIIVKDKHKNFYFKNDGHGPKLRSRHSPLALGTLVWSTWSEASSCSILWASETTGSTKKKKKRSVWEFLLLHILASIWCCHCFNSNYRGPRGRREKERVWENFWRDYGWKFPQHGKANSQSNPRGTESHIG